MAIITLSDGTELEAPDNPTAQDLDNIRKAEAIAVSKKQPKQAEAPKQKTTWGEDFTLAAEATRERLASGFDTQKDLMTLGTKSDEIKAQREARRKEFAANRENILKGKEQGFFGELVPSIVTGMAELPMLPYSIVGKAVNRSEDLEKATDPQTAKQAGYISALSDLAGFAAPASVAGGLATRAATGTVIGAGTGVLDQIITNQFLKLKGYDEVAKNYEPTLKDASKAALVGGVMGVVAGKRPAKPDPNKPSLADQYKSTIEADKVKTETAATNPFTTDTALAELKKFMEKQAADDALIKGNDKGPLKTGRPARAANAPANPAYATPEDILKLEYQIRQGNNNRNTYQGGFDSPEAAASRAMEERNLARGTEETRRQAYMDEWEAEQRNQQRLASEPPRQIGYNKPPVEMGGPQERVGMNPAEFAADSHAAAVRAARAAEAERIANVPGAQAQQAIDGQGVIGPQFGGRPSPDAAGLEFYNQPNKVVNKDPLSVSPETPPIRPDNTHLAAFQKAMEDANNRKSATGNPVADPIPGEAAPLSAPPKPSAVAASDMLQQMNDAVTAAKAKTTIPTRRVGPKSQRGAINFDAFLPKKSQNKARRPDIDHIIPDAGVGALRTMVNKGKGPLDDFLKDRPYSEIIAEVQANPGKDAGSTVLGRQLRGGISIHSTVKNDPITGKAYAITKSASNAPDNFAKQFITGDSLATRSGKLQDWHDQLKKTPDDFHQLMELMTTAAREGKAIPDSIIQQLTPEQRGFLSVVTDMFDDIYKRASKARESEGLGPLEKRPFYFPAQFTDTYNTLVFKKVMKDGKELLEPVGNLGSNTKYAWQGKNSIANLKKQFDGKSEYVLKDMPRRDLNTGDGGFAFEQGISRFIEQIKKNDPQLAANIKEQLDIENTMSLRTLYGMDKHEIHRKGIVGSIGDQPWLSRKENAEKAYESMINYAKQAVFYYEFKTKKAEFDRELAPIKNLRPKAWDEAQRYFANAAGTEVNWLGQGFNQAINLITDSAGISSQHLTKPLGEVSKFQTQLMIGTLNPMFIGQQWAQMLSSHLPYLELAQGRLGAGAVNTAGIAGKAGMTTSKLLMEHLSGKKLSSISDFDRRAFQYAKDNQMVNLTEMEHITHATQSKFGRGKDAVMELGPKIGEMTTRPTSFMVFANLIKEYGGQYYTDAQIFDIARSLTQTSMIAYDRIERPMLWNQMGIGGQYFGKFKTFPSGYLDSQRPLIKEAVKGYDGKRKIAPITLSAAAALTLGGVIGMPFFEDASDMITAGSELVGHRIDPKKAVLENLSIAASAGMLSDLTGMNLGTKFSAGNLVPDSAVQAAPVINRSLDQMTAVLKLVKEGATNEVLAAAGVAFSPPGPINQYIKSKLRKDEQGFLLDKKSNRESYRTEEEWTKSIAYGAPPITEALDKALLYQQQQEEKHLAKYRSDLIRKLHILNKENVDEKDPRRKAYLEAFLAAGGQPDELSTGLVKLGTDSNKTARQRAEGIELNTPQQQRRYLQYNRPNENR